MVEAMSRGLIPVTFSLGIAPEIIKNGKNGYIVKSLDEMINKINMLKSNPKKRRRLALNAVKTSGQFRSDVMIEEMAEVYRQLKYEKK